MMVFRGYRENPGRRPFEGSLLLISLYSIVLANGCSGVIGSNGGTNNQSTPQEVVKISSVKATAPTSSGFQVGWLTNVPTDSQIEYGISAAYGSSTPLNSTPVTVHQVNLSGLAAGTLYHYRVSTRIGMSQAVSADFSFATTGDATPPIVSITSPSSGATLSGTANLVASAKDNVSVASVQFKVDGANNSPPLPSPPYAYSLNTNSLSNGSHTLVATATDEAGNTASSTEVAFVVNNASSARPAVSITEPSTGANVSGTITVSGTASSSLSVSLVQVSIDNGNFSNAAGTNGWSFNLDTASLSNAAHTLTGKVTDSSGNTALSSPVSVTVNNGSGPIVTINWTDVHQQIDGFGAASAVTGDGITNSQADLFWSTTAGVGLSLLRVQIQTDGTYPDLATMQKAQDRGVKIWGTPWSPPASMKSNNSTNNGGSLLASDYQAYADYLSSYVLALKNSYGITLYALSIQNEPDYTATWQSCIWTGQQFHDFLRNNLLPTFAKHGVTTKVIMPEASGWKFDLATATLNDPVTAAGVSIIAGHSYGGASAAPFPLGQNQGKLVWETEVSSFEAFDPSMTNALIWAQKINDWMTTADANAWHYWWLIDGSSDNESLLGPSGQTTKRLYVMGNYSKFVRPGYQRIGTSASPVGGVSVSAYKDPSTGKFAIVAINHNGSAVTLGFVLNGFTTISVAPWVTSASLDLAQQASITVGGNTFVATLPAASVTTLVGP